MASAQILRPGGLARNAARHAALRVMERTGIEPVTSGLQSRATGDDERRRSSAIARNHAGLKRTADVGPASLLEAVRVRLGVE
jgi:hypothetical protein